MKIAFYKGVGNNIFNRFSSYAVKAFTGGKYSHVELIDDSGGLWRWYSASGFDDGVVRGKVMEHNPKSWDIFDVYPQSSQISFSVSCNEKSIWRFIKKQLGKGYDWRGILFSQIFKIKLHAENKWFCSELIHRSLCEGRYLIPRNKSNQISPNKLFKIMMNKGMINDPIKK